MYIHTGLHADEDWAFDTIYSDPVIPPAIAYDWGAIYGPMDQQQAENPWGGTIQPAGSPTVYSSDLWPTTGQQSSSWWTELTGVLVPISQAAGNIIRAVTGQPANSNIVPTGTVPPGYTRNASGQLVPIPGYSGMTPTWLMPAALGLGAFLLLKKGKK